MATILLHSTHLHGLLHRIHQMSEWLVHPDVSYTTAVALLYTLVTSRRAH